MKMDINQIRGEVENIAFLTMHQKIGDLDRDVTLDEDSIKREVVTIVDNLLVFQNPVLEEVSDMIIVVIVDRVVDDLMDKQKRKAFMSRAGESLRKLSAHIGKRRAQRQEGRAERRAEKQEELALEPHEERALATLVDVSRASVIISTPEAVINMAVKEGVLKSYTGGMLRVGDIKAFAIDRQIARNNL